LHRESHATLLCDRGTVNGAGFWPGGHDSLFKAIGSTTERIAFEDSSPVVHIRRPLATPVLSADS